LLHPVNPSSVFVTQDFGEWLKWFLSLPEVEDSIDKCSGQPFNQNRSTDYLNSHAYKKIAPQSRQPTTSSLSLVFGLFMDWLNPLGNKLL
jgi:hypothetical protein